MVLMVVLAVVVAEVLGLPLAAQVLLAKVLQVEQVLTLALEVLAVAVAVREKPGTQTVKVRVAMVCHHLLQALPRSMLVAAAAEHNRAHRVVAVLAAAVLAD